MVVMVFTGLTTEMCDNAFDITRAGFDRARQLEVVNKDAGTLVVINPFATPSNNDPSKVSLDEVAQATLFGRSINPHHEKADLYLQIALTKARELWVLRQLLGPDFTLRNVQTKYPHLYRASMVKYRGGICAGGVPIAFSGVQADYDEAFSRTFSAWMMAQCQDAVLGTDGVLADDGIDYIGGEEPLGALYLTSAPIRDLGRIATAHLKG
jgi:hypothetical protein